jgi:hypothetical protein
MGGNEDLTDFKGEKMENFANANAFDAECTFVITKSAVEPKNE